MMKPEEFIHMPIPASMFTAVCALLGGSALTAIVASGTAGKIDAAPQPEPAGNAAALSTAATADATISTNVDASPSDAIDAGGWAWDPALHASTKGVTKDGYWRMKVGVSRPDPKPGFPKSDGATSTASTGTGSPAPDTATVANAGQADDEDEFAAFRAAADRSNENDAAAAASVPARKWTDADLGALCNQAAVKMGDPAPVKAIIQEFVPVDAVPHSRNIPEDKREEFAKAVEAKAGIEFAG